MTETNFNPDAFMNTEIEGELSTRRIPVPEGEFPAVVEDVKAGTVGRDEPKPVLRVVWKIDDMDGYVQGVTGREDNKLEQLIFLDLTEQGGLDMRDGQNIGLGRLRKALGQNQPGQPWAPTYLIGQSAKIVCKHRADKNDPEVKYDGVATVLPIDS